jgi:hypothetical protein
MPAHAKGKTYTFYDASREAYPFYAPDQATAIRYALRWSRRTGIKLYRAKDGTSPYRKKPRA